ncbi:MAG TPA: MBL fold metallo-hydrolase, partial [Thermomicrobiales bacterium]|nr:MBL fold metallo-hydrolase [Thermomicrobiales bacterium]
QTHAHWDHVGGSHLFERVLAHPAEVESLRTGMAHADYMRTMARFTSLISMPNSWDPETAHIPGKEPSGLLNDGDTIDLGGRVLEAYETPGHAAGGMSFLDRTGRALFVGDAINLALAMLLCLDGSDPLAFGATLQRLAELAEHVDTIYPGHGPLLTPADVREIRDAWNDVLAGRAPDGQQDLDLGMAATIPVDVFSFGRFAFNLSPGALAGSD